MGGHCGAPAPHILPVPTMVLGEVVAVQAGHGGYQTRCHGHPMVRLEGADAVRRVPWVGTRTAGWHGDVVPWRGNAAPGPCQPWLCSLLQCVKNQ